MISFSDVENIIKSVKIEKKSLLSTLNIQKNLNNQILMFLKNFIGNINISFGSDCDNKAFYYMNAATINLNKTNNNISSINSLLKKLDEIESLINILPTDKLKNKIDFYNNQFVDAMNEVYDNTNNIEKFTHEISLVDFSELFSEDTSLQEKNIADESSLISNDELNSSFAENTLIISETQGKVILPYKMKDIKYILLDDSNPYSTIEDVINSEYTKSIKYYKYACIARFKEAYNLVKNKEKGSKFKALSLAYELFFNYNLHPAIISACKSLDELDIYLACLEDNTLNDFKFFNIKYEIPPTVAHNKNLKESIFYE